MDFREKAALILLAVILYKTVCSKCMPQCLRDSPFERYINKQKYSPNIPTTHENSRKTHRFQDDLIKQNKLYSKILPIDVSDSFINNFKREKRMKRKLQRAQKIYTTDNDETHSIPASFHNQGPPFYLSEVGWFPEVQYPLTASDTWTPNYWNSLPSNNHDRFFKKDAYFTDRKKPSTDSFHLLKQSPNAKNDKKLTAIVKKSKETLKRENNKKSSGAKSNKIVRQTTASQKKNVDSFEPKDENEIEKYLMKTPKLTEKKKTSSGTNEKIRQSKKEQITDSNKGLNQTISYDKSNKTHTNENTLKNKKIIDKKTNDSVQIINKTVSLEKISRLTEQKNTSKDENLENLKVEKTFSPKTKNTTEMKSVSKKSKSSIKEVTTHFSKLITKLEQLSNKDKVTSTTTSTNQIISSSPTNGTSNSANQEQEQETKVSAQNNLKNILQVKSNMSNENMETSRDELLNLVQSNDKTITSDEGAQTRLKTSKEESDLPFSFTDYVVRNQLLDVLSDPKLSISSLRNGIFKILEEIDSKSVEDLDETPLTGINESIHMSPLMDEYLNADNAKSLLPGCVISSLDTPNTPLENFNITILPCTNATDSPGAVIFKNNIDGGNVSEDDSYIPDHFVTGSLAENLRNVIAEPSSSNSLIEDLSEIIRLLTVWNSHIDDSGENVYQTTQNDTIDGYVPLTTQLSSEGGPKTAATDHSYEVISDFDLIDHSIKDETEYSCDIHKFNVTSHLKKDVTDCATEDIFKFNKTDHSIEDVTSYSCENNHELFATDYSREELANYSCEDNYKYNETEYSNENMADHTCEDIHNPNAKDHFNDHVADYSCEDFNKYTETEPSNENIVGTREDILKHNVSEGVMYYPIDDISCFNPTCHLKGGQTENLSENIHKLNSCDGVLNDSCEYGPEPNVRAEFNKNKSEYSNEDIHKPNTTVYSCKDAAGCLYEDKSKSNVTNNSKEANYSCERIRELDATCFSSKNILNDSCEDLSSNGNVVDTYNNISSPEVTDYSNEDINSLKVTVICSEGVNDNSYEEISKLNVTDQSYEDKTEYSCENIYKYDASVYSIDYTNDGSCEHFFKFNETKYSNENLDDTREDITQPNVNDYFNEGVVDNSDEYICKPNVTDNYSNEDENKNSCEGIHQPNAALYSCGDMTDCLNKDISSNVTYFSNEDVTSFSCEDIVKSNVSEYSNQGETEGLNDYSDEIIGEQNVTDHSNKTLADSCEYVGSFAMDNSSEVTNICQLKSNVTDHSNEILNDFSSEDIAISNVIKRKVKNMAKLNTLEHDTEDTEKHNITDYSSATIPEYSSNGLFKSNITNYLSEMLPNALENIPKAVEESKERIPESSRANYLNEYFEIDSDSPTIYHIPFEKLTYAINDNFSTIPLDVDDQTVNDKVTDHSMRTSHIELSDTTPFSVSPSFTYEVNEEIPETELVTFEKLNKITSTETITGKEIISNDNNTADTLPVFAFDDVFESLSDDSETPKAFVSTYLPSFDENILKLYNETETEMYENYLPTIPIRDRKTYDEVCPITGNESSENQYFMIDDPAYLNNSRKFTNDRKNLLNPFTNNITELFVDKEDPDFYDFILYPEEYEYTEKSENNDTRELNSDTTIDFTDYTVLPEETMFSQNNEENYIETLATTVNPFDQYDDVPNQNEESNVSEGSSKSNQNIHNVGNRYVTQDTKFGPNRVDKSFTDYTSLLEDPKLSKYLDDDFEEEHVFRPLYQRNVKPLLHRNFA